MQHNLFMVSNDDIPCVCHVCPMRGGGAYSVYGPFCTFALYLEFLKKCTAFGPCHYIFADIKDLLCKDEVDIKNIACKD